MAISYKKLWKLLIDRDMKKKELQELAGISSTSVTKLAKNQNVNTMIIDKVCRALNCDVADIMEFVPVDKQLAIRNREKTSKAEKESYAAEDVADRVGHDVSAEKKKAVNKGKEA